MSRFSLKLIGLALCAIPLSACNVWTVPEFNTVPFNAVSGDTVNVEMVDTTIDGVHPWDRCMNMGGRGMFHSTKEVAVSDLATAIVAIIICEGTDF